MQKTSPTPSCQVNSKSEPASQSQGPLQKPLTKKQIRLNERLLEAAFDLEKIKSLLDKGADPNWSRDEPFWGTQNVLLQCALFGRTDNARHLIEHASANPKAFQKEMETNALKSGCFETVQYFASLGLGFKDFDYVRICSWENFEAGIDFVLGQFTDQELAECCANYNCATLGISSPRTAQNMLDRGIDPNFILAHVKTRKPSDESLADHKATAMLLFKHMGERGIPCLLADKGWDALITDLMSGYIIHESAPQFAFFKECFDAMDLAAKKTFSQKINDVLPRKGYLGLDPLRKFHPSNLEELDRYMRSAIEKIEIDGCATAGQIQPKPMKL